MSENVIEFHESISNKVVKGTDYEGGLKSS